MSVITRSITTLLDSKTVQSSLLIFLSSFVDIRVGVTIFSD